MAYPLKEQKLRDGFKGRISKNYETFIRYTQEYKSTEETQFQIKSDVLKVKLSNVG